MDLVVGRGKEERREERMRSARTGVEAPRRAKLSSATHIQNHELLETSDLLVDRLDLVVGQHERLQISLLVPSRLLLLLLVREGEVGTDSIR
jgi:hypothetical protein